ncbi:MAG: hypothetical protein ACI8RD_001014, partial [Bacillariaceae sp.]
TKRQKGRKEKKTGLHNRFTYLFYVIGSSNDVVPWGEEKKKLQDKRNETTLSSQRIVILVG